MLPLIDNKLIAAAWKAIIVISFFWLEEDAWETTKSFTIPDCYLPNDEFS
ncbi:MAG: hypothetical protein ABIN01_25935 [Ferruginibacter sp.]